MFNQLLSQREINNNKWNHSWRRVAERCGRGDSVREIFLFKEELKIFMFSPYLARHSIYHASEGNRATLYRGVIKQQSHFNNSTMCIWVSILLSLLEATNSLQWIFFQYFITRSCSQNWIQYFWQTSTVWKC